MKRLQAILKDLQDSGQQASLIGHFTLQLGHNQKVTSIDNVREPSNPDLSETDKGKNPNRYTTEQVQNTDRILLEKPITSYGEAIPLDLIQIIAIWPYLPELVKKGMVAMSMAVASTI